MSIWDDKPKKYIYSYQHGFPFSGEDRFQYYNWLEVDTWFSKAEKEWNKIVSIINAIKAEIKTYHKRENKERTAPFTIELVEKILENRGLHRR